MGKKKSKERSGFSVPEFLKSAFEDLTAQRSEEEWILTSCTVNGEKSAAIAMIRENEGNVDIIPIFVGVTPNMVLLDPDGVAAKRQDCKDCLDADACSDRQVEDPHKLLH
jgi:hypothetical protein